MSFFEYYKEMQERGVILYFDGPISQHLVEALAMQVRNKMEKEEAGFSAKQRVFGILIEQMQNIVRYSSERSYSIGEKKGEGEVGCGQIIVGRDKNGRFFVESGNKINTAESVILLEQLEELQTMPKDKLKEAYKKQLRSKEGTSKGAGLGLLDMTRKALKPFDFKIVCIDNETSFFSMKVTA